MKTVNNVLIFGLLFLFFSGINSFSQKERSQIEDKYKWDLTDIYSTDDDWQIARKNLVKELEKVEHFKGKLTQSASDLLACLNYLSNTKKEAMRVFIYANMHYVLDTRNMDYLGMMQEIEQVFANFSSKAAYIDPEILSTEWETIKRFIEEEPELREYEHILKDLYRRKEHILSEKEERILALSTMATGATESVFDIFQNAEMPYPEVILSNGEAVVLSPSGYEKYRAAPNRRDRELVFKEFWNSYKNFQVTFGEMLNGQIKSLLFYAQARYHESTLEAALFENNIPIDVYHSLIDNVNNNLTAFHRYLDIKRRIMRLDTLKYIDLYAPAVEGIKQEYDYEEAKEIVFKSLEPLGDDYISIVEKALNDRWIDVYPSVGKISGAFSAGVFHDGHPYILLNFNGLYDDVRTFTHEVGHTVHSYFSNKTQPFHNSLYTIFVAEVASTINEVLLFEYMLKNSTDDNMKLSLLMDRLNGFKGTFFRQSQFAEFELKIHQMAQEGNALTGQTLSELYTEIVHKYYGHEEGVCKVDDFMNMEWAFIPHFYYNFYIYQYCTSFIASNTLAKRILNKEEGVLENYISFLSSGGSDYPIQQLKDLGIDMTSSEVFDTTIGVMNEIMDEIEKILDEKGV